MRLASALVGLAIATSPALAHADGLYFTEAFGPGAVRGDLSQRLDGGTFRIKIAAGYRAGYWALEPWLAAEMTNIDHPTFDDPDLTSYGVDLKRIVPVSEHVSVYLRGSLSHIAFPDSAPCCVLYDPGSAPSNADLYGYGGRGLGVGVGAQVSGKGSVWGLLAWPLFFLVKDGPQMNAALFIEDSYDYYRFQPPQSVLAVYRPSVDASITRLTFGFAVGTDF